MSISVLHADNTTSQGHLPNPHTSFLKPINSPHLAFSPKKTPFSLFISPCVALGELFQLIPDLFLKKLSENH